MEMAAPPPPTPPSSWLVEHMPLLRAGGHVLDVAAGRGRHALPMAAAGFRVTAVDRDADALGELARTAAASGVTIATEVRDLERDADVDLGEGCFDAVLVFNYLHRPLFPAILRALAPGGLLLYETFLAGQAARGHPKKPAFLLAPGELAARVAPLTIVRSREGEYDGKLLASVVARRDTPGPGIPDEP